MTYRIFAFAGLELSTYLQDGDDQNMGTGSALSAYLQLPGGFFDHYGDRKAPQGIRPITKRCLIVATDDNDMQSQIKALRGKIGVRGKLTIAWSNGQLWWQWARLKECDTPQPFEIRNTLVCPVTLTFETAAQYWFRVIVSPLEWTWGDSTWTFGDGTAVMGESGTLATLTETTGGPGQNFTINHAGNTDAVNVAVTITAGTSTIEFWEYINFTRRERMAGTTDISPGQKVAINAGDRSAWHYAVAKNINSVFNNTGANAQFNVTAHGLTTGDTIEVSGTGVFDGIHRNVTVSSTSGFTFPSTTWSGSIFIGSIRKLSSVYADFRSYNSKWPVLSPGDNGIVLYVTGNASANATIAWEFYEHNF